MIYKKNQTFGDSTLVCIVFFPSSTYLFNVTYIVLIPVIVYFPFLCICNYVRNYLCMYIHCYALQFPENGDWCGLNQDQAVYIPSVL